MSQTIKQKQIQQLEEDLAIAKYKQDKDRREWELQEEQRLLREAKEKETQKLREM